MHEPKWKHSEMTEQCNDNTSHASTSSSGKTSQSPHVEQQTTNSSDTLELTEDRQGKYQCSILCYYIYILLRSM
jgi:hypothetical protein